MMVQCDHKLMDMVKNNIQVDCQTLKNAQLVIKGPKCTKNISPPTLQQHRPELLIQGRVDPVFADVYTKFWPSQPNIAKEIDAYQTKEHF